MDARAPQVGVDQQGLAALQAVGDGEVDGGGGLAFARRGGGDEQAARAAVEVGKQDGIAQRPDGFFERGGLRRCDWPDFASATVAFAVGCDRQRTVPRQDFTTGSEPRTSVLKPFWICSGSRTVLSRTSARTAAPTPSRVEKRKARMRVQRQVRKDRASARAGRNRTRRMELFWKLELMPASLILRTSSS